MSIITFGSRKRYAWAGTKAENGKNVHECRIGRRRGNGIGFLSRQETASSAAVETVGNWCWIIDEIERAGMQPLPAHRDKLGLFRLCPAPGGLRRDKLGLIGPSTSLRVEQGSSLRLELGLIGFVFLSGAGRNIAVSVCGKGCCGDCGVEEIGFVLHN